MCFGALTDSKAPVRLFILATEKRIVMNRHLKNSLKVTAIASALALTSSLAVAQAQAAGAPVAGTQEVTLGGAGGSDKDFKETIMSVQGSWGTYFDSSAMWGLRQTVNVRDSDDSSAVIDGATRVFYDYHFGNGVTRPFIGANFGGFYGRNVKSTFAAGPELGVKHWLQSNVFMSAMVEYQFLFRTSSDARDRYDDGALLYSINLGYNF